VGPEEGKFDGGPLLRGSAGRRVFSRDPEPPERPLIGRLRSVRAAGEQLCCGQAELAAKLPAAPHEPAGVRARGVPYQLDVLVRRNLDRRRHARSKLPEAVRTESDLLFHCLVPAQPAGRSHG